MVVPMKRISVVKPFQDEVLPIMAKDGFQRFGGKKYGRVVGDVGQFFFLHVDSTLVRTFWIEFTTMLLCEPNEHVTLTLGGKFPNGAPRQGGMGWSFGARSEWDLTDNIGRVKRGYIEHCKPYLDDCLSLSGCIAASREMIGEPGCYMPHLHRTLACGAARIGDSGEALRLAKLSIAGMETKRGDVDLPWGETANADTRSLIEAMDEGLEQTLLEGWRAQTIQALGIERLDAQT